MNTVIVQLALSYLMLASGYNLDVQHATLVQDPRPSNERKSYFGYSVALYSWDNDSLVIVGAPRANSTRDSRRRIIEPGAVYLCNTKTERNCTEWAVDEVDYYPRGKSSENKNYAWLGATLQVENYRTPVVAVCSPRWYVWHYSLRKFGVCYSKTIEDPASFYTHNRINTRIHYFSDGTNRNYWMTGFALHIKPDNHDLIVGYSNGFHVFKHDQNCKVRNTYDTEINMNSGYSVTMGYFNGKDRRYAYATGVPRSESMKGAVRIYSAVNLVQQPKKNSQVGEYFGFSLAACDVNNDGRDDLLVGAPLWSKDGDEGRIAIYLSKNEVNKANEKLYTYSGVEETSSVESIAFEHIYEIQKFGVSPIEEVTFLLRVPTHWNGVQVSTINKLESQVDDVQYKNANESTIPLSKYTFRYKEENMTLLSRENQTYYLNYTTEEVECPTFLWTLGPFRKPQSSAKVTVQFELLLSNQMAAVIKDKDILFLSEATVKITKPDKTMETSEKRPNYKQISTFFIHRSKPETVAVWIIVLSVLLGVVLMILATAMLYKLGFFKRKRIEDRHNLSNQQISEELFN